MENKDCPLCGEKGVITYTPSKEVTHVHPGPKRLGNYTRGFEGGGYDLSHAKTCKKLLEVIHKEDLLGYFIGSIPVRRADLFSFFDYKKALRVQYFYLKINVFAEEGSLATTVWKYEAFLECIGSSDKKWLETKASKPDEAFNLLRHRLLCGEILEYGRGCKLQLKQGPTLEFVKI